MPRIGSYTGRLYFSLALLLSNSVTAESNCNPLSAFTCTLPYPSNIYTEIDESSPTGIRLKLTGDEIPEGLLVDAPAKAHPTNVLNGLPGYSALTPVEFELLDAIDINTLPLDGGDALKVFDLNTGELKLIRADAAMPAMVSALDNPSMVVEGYPIGRWDWEHTYVAVLTKSLKNIDGNDFEPPAGVIEALTDDSSDLAAQYRNEIEFLEQKGIAREDILSLTSFTVRDEESATAPMLKLINIIYSQDHPMTIDNIIYLPTGPVAAWVYGKVKLTSFRTEDGSVDFNDTEGHEYMADYDLALPRQAANGPVPIALYGHGIVVNKATGIFAQERNAENGIATIAIDHPNHGSRISADGYLTSHFKTTDILHVTGMAIQSALDFHSLLAAVQQNLDTKDLLPDKNPFMPNALFPDGVNVADIDTDNAVYMGTSLGALFGTQFAATSPGLKGALLQVAGAGIGNTLLHTAFYDFLGLQNLVPKDATGAEAIFLLNAVLHRVDPGDGLNYAHYFRNPPANSGLEPRPIVVQYGIGDTIVYNGASHSLAEAANLPVVTPAPLPLDYLEETQSLTDSRGYALVQSPKTTTPLMDNNPNVMTDLISHMTFIDAVTGAAMDEWYQAVIFNSVSDKTSTLKPSSKSCDADKHQIHCIDIKPASTEPTQITAVEPTPEPTTPESQTTATREATSQTPASAVAASSSGSGGSMSIISCLLLLAFIAYRKKQLIEIQTIKVKSRQCNSEELH